MAKKENAKKEQLNNLKSILSGFGINSNEELDSALSEMLDALNIGIMTEKPKTVRNTA